MYDGGIMNGRIYTEHGWVEGNLYIAEGKIAEITRVHYPAKEEYDACGRYVLPGFIDPHVHFALQGGSFSSVDDFRTGSISAAFGGITTYIDFLDPIRTVGEIEAAFEQRMNLAASSVLDYGFHLTLANPLEKPETLVQKARTLGMPSIKVFTAYSSTNRRTSEEYIERILKISRDEEILLLVHAEDENKVREGKGIAVEAHELSRPAAAEIEQVMRLAEIARATEGRLYIVHTSCGSTVEKLKDKYADVLGKSLFLESCPHYYLFDSSVYCTECGGMYTMTPPLRQAEEKEKLMSSMESVQVIATDHCPFNKSNKLHGYTCEIPMGIGGVEHSFSTMYTLFGDKIIDRFTINPAKIHGLYPRKGTLLPGSDADIVIFDSETVWKVKEHHSACDYSVYEGMEMKGKVISTLSRPAS